MEAELLWNDHLKPVIPHRPQEKKGSGQAPIVVWYCTVSTGQIGLIVRSSR